MEGVNRVEEIIVAARQAGIAVLTLYAFSTENWTRPQEEVTMLMRLFIRVLGQKAKDLHANGVRIRFIGRRELIPEEVLRVMDASAQLTAGNTGMTLNVAFNYGARAEIVDAVRAVGKAALAGGFNLDTLDEEQFSRFLYTQEQPEVDLLIRTSGEFRISNFLLWQISYAELYFTPKFWPEFTKEEFQAALQEFAGRQRRYGGI